MKPVLLIVIGVMVLGVVGWQLLAAQRPEPMVQKLLPTGVPIPQGDAMIVRYGQHHRQMLEAFVPAEPAKVLVLLIHGGSWVAGDKGQLAPVGRYLAKQGFSAVTMNYRLAPEVTYEGILDDIASVIKLIEADPQLYGLEDSFSLVTMGYSAGGHLAALVSLSEERLQVRPVSLCVSFAGIYDLGRIVRGDDGPILVEPTTMLIGEESEKAGSPVALVQENESTSFLLFWGDNDDVVRAEQMAGFADILVENGGLVEAITLPGRNHQDLFATVPSGDEVATTIVSRLKTL